MLQSRTVLRVSVCAAVLAAAATSAVAVTNEWQGPDFGDWYQPPNWTLNHVPLATEDAVIDNGTTAQLDVPGALAEAHWLTVGDANSGGLRHVAGSLSVEDRLYVGYDPNGQGTYELSGSPAVQLSAWNEYIGEYGTGQFLQSGGTNTLGWNLCVGYRPASMGTYVQNAGAVEVGSTLYIGFGGTGEYLQAGGTNEVDILDLGQDTDGNGTYELSGPETVVLSAGSEGIGGHGIGTFIQSGGTHAVARNVWLGDSGGTGTYIQSGGSLDVGTELVVAYFGTGAYVQTEGTNQVGTTLCLGWEVSGNGTYLLSGGETVLLSATDEVIGKEGVGSFVQSGGTNVVGGELILGMLADGSGTYELHAGELEAHDGYIGGSADANGGSGAMGIWPDGTATVGGALKLFPDGQLDLYGGTLVFRQSDPLVMAGGTLNYCCGTIEFDGDMVIAAGNGTVAELFGSPVTIPAAKTLSVTGTATLAAPVTLEGGTLKVGALANPGLLTFNTGVLWLTDSELLVGPGGLLGCDVTVSSDQAVAVMQAATVVASGELTVDGGRFYAGELVNEGQIRFGPAGGMVVGALTNMGIVTGGGTIAAVLDNTSTGEVSAAAGERLILTGPTNTNAGSLRADGGEIELVGGLSNSGRITVLDGRFRAGGAVTNAAAGNISGEGDTTLIFDGGLENHGVLGVTFAEARIEGGISNAAEGILSVAGSSTATFAGDVVNDGTVYVGPGSTAVFMGHVSGPGDFPGGGLVEFVDGFSPGGSAGVVAFGGSVALACSAALEIELANPDNSDPLNPRYDALDVTGEASLAGTLALEWLPVPGDAVSTFGGVYELIASEEGITGEFSDVACAFEAYIAGIAYDVDVNGDGSVFAVELTLHDLIVGDADFDGVVDYDDYAALRDHFGQTAGAAWALGDFDLDGDVDWHDYVALKGHWGQALPPGAPAIPEPTTLALLALGAAMAMGTRRPRTRR